MKFSEAVAEEARRFKQGTGEDPSAEFVEVAKPCINLALTDVGDSWRWKHLEKSGSLVVLPTYATGTANISQDSNSITLVAPAVASDDFVGRFWRKRSGSNQYRILSRSGQVLVLDQPIIESTENGIEYEIEEKFYPLPPEVREIIGWDSGVNSVMGLNQRGLQNTIPNYTSPIQDIPFDVAGYDEYSEDYTEGRITVAANSNIVTNNSSSCAWLSKAFPGSAFTVSDVVYRVKRVESNQQLRLYNMIAGGVQNESYTLSNGNNMTMRPYAAFTAKRLIQFQYIRHHYGLVHDDEFIILPEKAILAVLDFAQAYIFESLQKSGWESQLLKANGRLASAQATSSPVRAAFKMFPPLVPRGMGRR